MLIALCFLNSIHVLTTLLPWQIRATSKYITFCDSEIKERIKKTKDEKKAKKAEMAKSQKTAGKGNAPKPGKGPKLGGGGGKR